MDRVFLPCNRYRDAIESQDEDLLWRDPEHLQEINLNVSTEEFLSAERAFTFADLYATLGNSDTLAWLTPHAAVVRDEDEGEAVTVWADLAEACGLDFSADGIEIVAMALSPEHLLEICDVVLRLLAVSVVHSIRLANWSPPDLLINHPTLALAYLMDQCRSLTFLSLKDLKMDENHCRVLGAYSRLDLEIVLEDCGISDAGASILA
jgi:hypothetical protein